MIEMIRGTVTAVDIATRMTRRSGVTGAVTIQTAPGIAEIVHLHESTTLAGHAYPWEDGQKVTIVGWYQETAEGIFFRASHVSSSPIVDVQAEEVTGRVVALDLGNDVHGSPSTISVRTWEDVLVTALIYTDTVIEDSGRAIRPNDEITVTGYTWIDDKGAERFRAHRISTPPAPGRRTDTYRVIVTRGRVVKDRYERLPLWVPMPPFAIEPGWVASVYRTTDHDTDGDMWCASFARVDRQDAENTAYAYAACEHREHPDMDFEVQQGPGGAW